MSNNKLYTCECGRTFTTPNAFNGHKSHCQLHLSITGRLSLRTEINRTNGVKQSASLKQYYSNMIQQRELTWINERHRCERCGKIMTEKYASGRFCSRSCAAARIQTDIIKQRIGDTLRGRRPSNIIGRSEHIVTHCQVCGKELPYTQRNRKTCSKECYHKLLSVKATYAVRQHGGNMNARGLRSYKSGNYRGYHCDSSWELAFVVTRLRDGIVIERNKQGFPYLFQGAQHYYYPDFIINGEYYEIKNYLTDEVRAKIEQFPEDKVLHVLYYPQLKDDIDYCVTNYGIRYWEVLYNNND